MNTYALGYNFGNRTTKAVAYNGTQQVGDVIFLSDAKMVDEATLRLQAATSIGEGSVAGQVTPFDETPHLLSYKGEYSIHGVPSGATGMGDISRYWERDVSARNLLVAAALTIPDQSFAIDVVTHLPAGESYNEYTIDLITRSLSRAFAFTLDGRERHITATMRRVVMEGAGTMIAYGSSQKKADQVSVEFGYYSTDVFRLKNSRPEISLCGSIPIGVGAIADLINAQARVQYQGFTFSPDQMHALLFAAVAPIGIGGVPSYPPFKYQGQMLSNSLIHSWYIAARERVYQQELLPFLNRKLKTNEAGAALAAGLDTVLAVGGGAYHFTPCLLPSIPHLQQPTRAEMADTVGFAFLANAMAQAEALRSR